MGGYTSHSGVTLSSHSTYSLEGLLLCDSHNNSLCCKYCVQKYFGNNHIALGACAIGEDIKAGGLVDYMSRLQQTQATIGG